MIPTYQRGGVGRRRRNAAPVTDPFWANVVMLMTGQGTHGGTSTTDASGRHTFTFNGNAQVSTSDTDFPGGAVLLDGVSDSLSVGNTGSGANSDFSAANSVHICFDLWVKFSSFQNGLNTLINQYTGAGTPRWSLGVLVASGVVTDLQMRLGDAIVVNRSLSLSTGELAHLAWCRDASNHARWFKNGTQLGTTDTTSFAGTQVGTATAIAIGSQGPTFPNDGECAARLAGVRITNGGTARYTAAFTPPPLPLPTS